MQEWLDDHDILMHSTHNEVKLVIAERFKKTLKTKIHKKWQQILSNDSKSCNLNWSKLSYPPVTSYQHLVCKK